MINLVPLLRADRLREIHLYKDKGYDFNLREASYNYVRNISVSNKSINKEKNVDNDVDKVNYFFQVRTNQSEPRFYICKKNERNIIVECCAYLTIYEIYEVLLEISKELTINEVTEILKSERNITWFINYTQLEFEFKCFSKEVKTGELNIPNTNINILYEVFFILIALIQDKSNYYCGISVHEDIKENSNGIVRLLICLLNTKHDFTLRRHGWNFDNNNNKYVLDKNDDQNKSKYYLTRQEYNDIMGVKS